MMATNIPTDETAAAAQFGAIASTPPAPAPTGQDETAAAQQFGAIEATPPASQPPVSTLESENDAMTRAMSGQPMSTPEGQKQFDAGREAGTKAAAGTIASEAGSLGLGQAVDAALTHLGAFAKAGEAAKVGTGLYDQYGDEIFKELPAEAKSIAQQIMAHPTVQKAMKKVAGSLIGRYLGPSAGAVIGDRIGRNVAGEPGALVGDVAGATAGETISRKVLQWILGEAGE